MRPHNINTVFREKCRHSIRVAVLLHVTTQGFKNCGFVAGNRSLHIIHLLQS